MFYISLFNSIANNLLVFLITCLLKIVRISILYDYIDKDISSIFGKQHLSSNLTVWINFDNKSHYICFSLN